MAGNIVSNGLTRRRFLQARDDLLQSCTFSVEFPIIERYGLPLFHADHPWRGAGP